MYLQIVAILTVIMVCIPLAAPDEFSSFMDLLTFFSISFIVVILLAIPIWCVCRAFIVLKSAGKNDLIVYLSVVGVISAIFIIILSPLAHNDSYLEFLSIEGGLFFVMLLVAVIISMVLAVPIWGLWRIYIAIESSLAKSRKKKE